MSTFWHQNYCIFKILLKEIVLSNWRRIGNKNFFVGRCSILGVDCNSFLQDETPPSKQPKSKGDGLSSKDLWALHSAQTRELKLLKPKTVTSSPTKEELKKQLEVLELRANMLSKHNEQIMAATLSKLNWLLRVYFNQKYYSYFCIIMLEKYLSWKIKKYSRKISAVTLEKNMLFFFGGGDIGR